MVWLHCMMELLHKGRSSQEKTRQLFLTDHEDPKVMGLTLTDCYSKCPANIVKVPHRSSQGHEMYCP